MTTSTSTSQTPRVRIRTLHVCEPSYPSRDIVRQENYIRRKAQELQGWCCPRTVPYQGIDPVRSPLELSKSTTNERITNATPAKSVSKISSDGSGFIRSKSGSVGQDENLMKTQFETNIRRLQTAQQKHMKKSNDILKRVQLGHSIKDVVGKFPRANSTRVDTADTHRTASVNNDEKESDILYDRLLDDFEEEDDMDGSSESDIRDDIMSPRTITNTNLTSTDTTEITELHKIHPPDISFLPVKLCQSAPPLNRNNLRQATLRPFTPRYSSLSARLRLTRHMPFRDALYRQLCCILWLLRAMGRSDWSEVISGCWNIDQWLRNDSRSHTHSHHHQQAKKQHESNKGHHTKFLPSELKSISTTTNTSKENAIASLRTVVGNTDTSRKQHLSFESNITRLPETSFDDQIRSRSRLSDASERLDLQLNSTNIDSDLNESSSSSRSKQGDSTEHINLDSSHQTTNIRSLGVTPAILITNTSRTSTSTNFGQSTGRATIGRLTSIMERRRSPDALLKRWVKNQKMIVKDSDEPLPLNEAQIRLLRVGDNDDLKRIFGLENATDVNKEQVKVRRTREIEQKLVANIKRRSATSVGSGQSKRHAQILQKIKRDFNDFTEEQSIILNNKLEQADNDRLFYCQTKLRELQQKMPPLTILDRLLKHLRYDEDKKKIDAAYLKYQSWYVDLLQMVQTDYSDDHIIILLLKEMEEFANPNDKPTVIRFKAVLSDLKAHEICHPDVMAAIEFIRIHVVRMGDEEFDKFFCRQFPTVTKYIMTQSETTENDDTQLEVKPVI
ncbi:unnamed protein product [Rotaria sordida]|uniref:Uncharacterized protein n=1 Tax=Rotaria sordida TaxID=392033 RepID=A0A814WR45_9BILA|nr:unnamed protein product [Rotaria sordida]